MRPGAAVCLGVLLLGTACRWAGMPTRETIYAAHEAGLTLQYENPMLPPGARFNERIQVRVAASKDHETGRAVRITYTSLRGEFSTLYFLKDGGVFLSQDGKTPGLTVHPVGFPDRVTHWEVRETKFRVLGRAQLGLPDLKLPETADRVGVWVESESPQGLRQRTFLLPDIGEVETVTWHDGAWVCTNRLVARGFSDAPQSSRD